MVWETSSGLLDEYEGTVAEAWFDTDLDYQNGEALLLHWQVTDIVADGAAHDEITEKFSVGAGWSAVDNKQRAEKEYGDSDFNENSKYGRIIDRVATNEGAFEGALDVVAERGDEKDATVWEGLRFRFARETVDYGGEIGERTFIMPVEFLGVADEVSEVGKSNGSSEASREELVEKLTELAKEVDSHTEFLAKAADVEGVVDNDALFEQVADESEDGFYATATAA